MNKEVYFLSGLGADERAFYRLDFDGFSVNHIKWITPKPKETIENYATRLIEQIKSEKPILVGLSFGGIVAVEIAKQMETEKVILISSIKSKSELPLYLKLLNIIRIHKLIPMDLIKKSSFIIDWFFGVKSELDKQLLKQILKDTDVIFLKWAIDMIAKWKNTYEINNLTHIHGSKDRTFPVKYINSCIKIEKAGHLMILNKPDEINEILSQQVLECDEEK